MAEELRILILVNSRIRRSHKSDLKFIMNTTTTMQWLITVY